MFSETAATSQQELPWVVSPQQLRKTRVEKKPPRHPLKPNFFSGSSPSLRKAFGGKQQTGSLRILFDQLFYAQDPACNLRRTTPAAAIRPVPRKVRVPGSGTVVVVMVVVPYRSSSLLHPSSSPNRWW